MASLNSITDQTVRHIRKTAETPPRVSVLDVIGAITGLDSSNSSTVYARLREQFPEIATRISIVKFPGRGQRDTPVVAEADQSMITALLTSPTARLITAGLFTGGPGSKRRRVLADDLYVMRYSTCSRSVKIGRSKDAEKRRRALQTCQNFFVEIVALFPERGHLEHLVHAKLHDKQSHDGAGTEWFYATIDEALDTIRQVILECNTNPSTPEPTSVLD